MDKKIRILVADDIQATRDVIRQLIEINDEGIQIIGEAANGAEAVKLARQLKPDMILMDINMPELNGLEAAQEIMAENPNSIIIIMSVQSETEYLKQAMFSGAKEYIIKPFDYDTLMGTLTKTYERYKPTILAMQQPASVQASSALVRTTGHVLSFFSTKGGVGKSFIALNSALALSTVVKKKTLLIDLDLQFGDIALMIDRPNSKTLYDLISDVDLMDYEAYEPYLVHYNDDLDILLAPKSPEEAEYVQKSAIESIISTVLPRYEMILFDLPVSFNEINLGVMDLTEKIFIVSTMDLMALKNTRVGLGVMKSLHYADDKVKIIINRRNEGYGIKTTDVEKLFNRKPFMSLIDDEKSTCLSINMGIPYLLNPKFKGSKLYKEIVEFTNKLTLSNKMIKE